MESIEQPIFNPYPIVDDKEELIDDPSLCRAGNISSNNSNGDTSPVQATKSLLSNKDQLASQQRGLWIIIICTVVFAAIITVALALTIYFVPKQVGGHAAIVTEAADCTNIGLEVLRRGGNAVDAAVASAFCLGVVHPQGSGLGGGGFLLYHDHKNGKSVAYDFRETAPAAATSEMLSTLTEEHSGLVVGVPGELKGLEEAHKDLGRMDWEYLIQPAIDLATHGFNVTKALEDSLLHHVLDLLLGLDTKSKFLNVFVNPHTSEFYKKGERMSRPDLARALELVKTQGSRAFYEGVLGEKFFATVLEHGGRLSMEDLRKYAVVKTEPVTSTFGGYKVLGMPAPSSGPVLALMLNMMQGFNWTAASGSDPKTYQQMIETFKFGFAHRSLLGDPRNPQYAEAIENATRLLLSSEYAAKLSAKVDNVTHEPSYYGPSMQASLDKGTSHISIIDHSEVMVSLTLSNNYMFGSKLITPDGILANNQMMDFSYTGPTATMPLNKRNQIVPGMRPLSSMTPTIAYSRDHPCGKRLILGASNGTRIITGVIETLVNALVFNMDVQEAVSRPRIHNQLYPNDITEYEKIFSPDAPGGKAVFPQNIVSALASVQKMVPTEEGLSCVQAILKLNDDVHAYADWRKGGQAATI